MGSASSVLTDVQLRDLAQQTPFKPRELEKLMKRYSDLDPSERGLRGIPYEECIRMPEFSGNKLVPRVVTSHMDKGKTTVFPKQFLLCCSILSSKTDPRKKKEYLFEMFDEGKTDVLTHHEMFKIYKTLLGTAVTDAVILDLTFRALKHPDLHSKGEITRDEFIKMIPDSEIMQRMTADVISG